VRGALVTGAAGFVGRHMLAELVRRGWDALGVDLRRGHRLNGGTLLELDARDVFAGHRCPGERFDLVVHCAYHVGGRVSIDGNPSLLALNLELDARMFDWAVRTGQGAVMYLSSSAVYPISLQRGGPQPSLAECMIDSGGLQPDARYGWAKLTGERLATAATEQGLRVHVLRPFSGYGGDQDDCYPFPAIAKRVMGGDMTVWGPPGQTRDWIHIDDVVAGALAVHDADYRDPVNLCTGVGTEFGTLATMMAREAGIEVGPVDPRGRSDGVTYREDRPTGVLCRVGDPTRMLDLYTPTIALDEGIRRVLSEVATRS